MVPDFFSDEYYERARDALKRVDGMALSNLLSGRAFNILFREVFSEGLEPSSRHMVAIVKEYMERVLKTLFHKACEYYPGLLSEINGALVEEFMESKEKNTLKAVANVVNAELDWVFTQDRGYVKLIEDVREKVDQVRAEELCSKATKEADTKKSRFTAPQADAGVDDVPSEFIQKMVSSKSGKDEGTRELQVRSGHGFLCICGTQGHGSLCVCGTHNVMFAALASEVEVELSHGRPRLRYRTIVRGILPVFHSAALESLALELLSANLTNGNTYKAILLETPASVA